MGTLSSLPEGTGGKALLAPRVSWSARRSSLIVLILASCLVSAFPTRASGGTLRFHAIISGQAHDTGGFSQAVRSAPAGQPLLALLFVGCAVITQKLGGGPATYQLQVRTTGTYLPGMKPTQAGVNLTVDNFHPTTGARRYTGADVAGTFAINGHAYGDGSYVMKSAAQVRNGGLIGTWTDTAAVRNYPAKGGGTVRGFQFRATWSCTSLFHITAT